MVVAPVESPRRLQRIPAEDISTTEAIFRTALSLLVPEDQTQRKAFGRLMPHMYVLRNKGCSWPQLTKLLTDCGFRLQPSTVRSYYSEMLAQNMDECQARMNEQLLLMAEIRKATAGADMGDIAARVASKAAQTNSIAGPKMDAIFGRTGVVAAPALQPVAIPVAMVAPDIQNKKTGLRPAPGNPSLSTKPQTPSAPPAVVTEPFTATHHDDPTVPDLQKQNAAASPQQINNVNQSPMLECCRLQDGVTPLKKRDGIPAEVYSTALLEHPAVPGLVLTLPQRIYGTALEIKRLDDGEIRFETADEKRFRVMWKKPIPISQTKTSANFVKMDESLFAKK